MRPISSKNKQEININPYFKKCHRHKEGTCQGRITIDHAWIYAGRQIDELWNFVPTCAFHHNVDQFQDCGDLNKDKQQRTALLRATDEDLQKYYKKDWNYEKLKLKIV